MNKAAQALGRLAKPKHPGESVRLPGDAYVIAEETASLLGIPISAAAAVLIRTGASRLEIFTAPIGKVRQRRRQRHKQPAAQSRRSLH